MSENLLQPLWSYLIDRWGHVISYWFFPLLVGMAAFVVVGIYFVLKDFGPWRSEATRIYKDVWPTKWKVFEVGGIQMGIYVLLNLIMWNVFPYHVELPAEAPTVWELVRDLTLSLLVSDFLTYLEHIINHKIRFMYTHVHYVHHCFKADVFAWCAGWVHPFESVEFFLCMTLFPWLLYPVHPLTLWIHMGIFVALLLEEHSGHDVWWSPPNWVPVIFGGGVPHIFHHTKVTTNYGFLFAIWDRIFGTYLDPSCELKGVK